MLFTKISSKPSLSKSAEIIVLTLDGTLNSELAMSINIFSLTFIEAPLGGVPPPNVFGVRRVAIRE